MAVMILDHHHAKLNNLIAHYRAGDLPEAARRVRSLSKAQLVGILLANHQLSNGFAGDALGDYEFQCFVDRAISGWNE